MKQDRPKFETHSSNSSSRLNPVLAFVVPCYNEEEALAVTIPAVLEFLDALSQSHQCSAASYAILVDDGSTDGTWEAIIGAKARNPEQIVGIRLATNAGHQYALVAGIDYAAFNADISVSIDADMQHDLNAVPEMISDYRSGAEIVLGIKRRRASDTAIKRWTASRFYKLMQIMGVNIEDQHADFRLMSSFAMRSLGKFPEYHLFLRGFPHLLHNRVTRVYYDVSPRNGGSSKYSIARMLSLAWNGITSFSVVPLRVITIAGAVVFVISAMLALGSVLTRIGGEAVPGWASITAPLYSLGGLLMLSIGIVGEYVGKIFVEVKRRPRYIVDSLMAINSNIDAAQLLPKDD